MSSISIEGAKGTYGGATEEETLRNMAQSGGYLRIWKYANDYGDKKTHTDYYRSKSQDDFPSGGLVHNVVLVYDNGKLTGMVVMDAKHDVIKPESLEPEFAELASAVNTEKNQVTGYCEICGVNPGLPVHFHYGTTTRSRVSADTFKVSYQPVGLETVLVCESCRQKILRERRRKILKATAISLPLAALGVLIFLASYSSTAGYSKFDFAVCLGFLGIIGGGGLAMGAVVHLYQEITESPGNYQVERRAVLLRIDKVRKYTCWVSNGNTIVEL